MAWYNNKYSCGECGTQWEDQWSCTCDDECPNCGASDYSPTESEDLSAIVETDQDDFYIYVSPSTAGHGPDYRLLAITPSKDFAILLKKIAMELPDRYLNYQKV